jgi:hypothetical protein
VVVNTRATIGARGADAASRIIEEILTQVDVPH